MVKIRTEKALARGLLERRGSSRRDNRKAITFLESVTEDEDTPVTVQMLADDWLDAFGQGLHSAPYLDAMRIAKRRG